MKPASLEVIKHIDSSKCLSILLKNNCNTVKIQGLRREKMGGNPILRKKFDHWGLIGKSLIKCEQYTVESSPVSVAITLGSKVKRPATVKVIKATIYYTLNKGHMAHWKSFCTPLSVPHGNVWSIITLANLQIKSFDS